MSYIDAKKERIKMNKHTIASMITTIILFIAAVVMIAVGINMVLNPVTYHYGHGFFSYRISYVSSHTTTTANILFALGRTLLLSSFVMLGFTLYFSTKGKEEKGMKNKSEVREKRVKDESKVEDATIKEEVKTTEDNE